MSRTIRNIAKTTVLAALCLCAVLLVRPQAVWAADSAVTFGSTSYTASRGGQLKVGVYIRSSETPGPYHVELAYDSARLEYLNGADDVEDGRIVLEGTAVDTEVKYMLYFKAVEGGHSGIIVSSAEVYMEDGETLMEITKMAKSPINISGSDNTGAGDYDFAVEDDQEGEPLRINDIAVIGSALNGDGEDLYLVDLKTYAEEGHSLPFETCVDTYWDQEVTFITDRDQVVRLIYLMKEDGELSLYASGDDEIFYECGMIDNECFVSPYAALSWPEGLSESLIQERKIVYRIQEDGTGAFCRTDGETPLLWDEEAELPVKEENTGESEASEESEVVSESEAAEEAVTEKAEEAKPAEKEEASSDVSLSRLLYGILGAVGILILLLILIPVIRRSRRKKIAKDYLASLPPEAPYAENEEKLKKRESTEGPEEGRRPVKTAPGRTPAAKQPSVEPEENVEISIDQVQITQDPEELMPVEETILTGIASEIADMKAEMKEEPMPDAGEKESADYQEEESAFDVDDLQFEDETGEDFLSDFEKKLEEALKDLD